MDPFVAPPWVPLLGFAPLKASRLVRLRKTSTAFRVFIQYVAEYLALRNSAQDDTESVCAAVCVCLRTTDGRPYGSNMVRRSVAKLTSVRIQGVDAFGVSEIDLKHVPNR